MSGDNQDLVVMEIDDQIATIILNSPPANLISQAMINELSRVFQDLEDIKISVVVLTGQGAHSFSAGAHIGELAENNIDSNKIYFSKIYATFNQIATSKYPVIAAINGYAFGAGLELALCADIRVMDEKAQLCASGVNLDLVFCTQRLPRLVGAGRAFDMLLQARSIGAVEALNYGLIEYGAPAGTVRQKAAEIARVIAQKGQPAVRSVKQVLNRGLDLPLNQALDLEAGYLDRMFSTMDFARRARSFLDSKKRIDA